MVVEVSPFLGIEELDATVEGSRGSHEQAKQRGIEGGDIIEMYQLGLSAHQLAIDIDGRNDDE